jgi:hypothetical protein
VKGVLKLLVVLAATGVLAGAAFADTTVPPGFKANPRLSKPVTWIAGHPVTAYCAPTAAAMNALVSPTAKNVQGATPVIGGNVINLSPLTCAYLTAWLNGKKPSNLYGVAGSMETLAHESELAKGISDETSATCAGLKAMPSMVTKFFPLKRRMTLHAVMAYAYELWNAQGPSYHAHPCP